MLLSAAGWNFIDNDPQAQNFSEGADAGAYLVISGCYLFAAIFDLGFLWDYMTGVTVEPCNQRVLLAASLLNIVCAFETVLGSYLRYIYVLDPNFAYLSWSFTLDAAASVLWTIDAIMYMVGYRLVDARDADGHVIWCPTMNFTLLADLFSVSCCVLYTFEAFFYFEVYVTFNSSQSSEVDTDGLQGILYNWGTEVGNQADFTFLTCCILLCIDNVNSVRYGDQSVIPQTTRRESMIQAKTRRESFVSRNTQPLLSAINADT